MAAECAGRQQGIARGWPQKGAKDAKRYNATGSQFCDLCAFLWPTNPSLRAVVAVGVVEVVAVDGIEVGQDHVGWPLVSIFSVAVADWSALANWPDKRASVSGFLRHAVSWQRPTTASIHFSFTAASANSCQSPVVVWRTSVSRTRRC